MLADGVEEHDGDRLGIFADGESADSGDGHEGELVEHVAAGGLRHGLANHGQTDGKIGRDIPQQAHPRRGQEGRAGMVHPEACGQQQDGERRPYAAAQGRCAPTGRGPAVAAVRVDVSAAGSGGVDVFMGFFVTMLTHGFLALIFFFTAKLPSPRRNRVAIRAQPGCNLAARRRPAAEGRAAYGAKARAHGNRPRKNSP